MYEYILYEYHVTRELDSKGSCSLFPARAVRSVREINSNLVFFQQPAPSSPTKHHYYSRTSIIVASTGHVTHTIMWMCSAGGEEVDCLDLEQGAEGILGPFGVDSGFTIRVESKAVHPRAPSPWTIYYY